MIKINNKEQTPYTELGFIPIPTPTPPEHLQDLVNHKQLQRMDFTKGIHFNVQTHVQVQNHKGEILNDFMGVGIVLHAPLWNYFSPLPLKDGEFDISSQQKEALSSVLTGLDSRQKWEHLLNDLMHEQCAIYEDECIPEAMIHGLLMESLKHVPAIKKLVDKTYLQSNDLESLGWKHNILKDPTICVDNLEGSMVWMPRKDFMPWMEKTLATLHALDKKSMLGAVTASLDGHPVNDWIQIAAVCTASKNTPTFEEPSI